MALSAVSAARDHGAELNPYLGHSQPTPPPGPVLHQTTARVGAAESSIDLDVCGSGSSSSSTARARSGETERSLGLAPRLRQGRRLL